MEVYLHPHPCATSSISRGDLYLYFTRLCDVNLWENVNLHLTPSCTKIMHLISRTFCLSAVVNSPNNALVQIACLCTCGAPNAIPFPKRQGCTFNTVNELVVCVFPLHKIRPFYGLFGSKPPHPRNFLFLASMDGMQVSLHSWLQ